MQGIAQAQPPIRILAFNPLMQGRLGEGFRNPNRQSTTTHTHGWSSGHHSSCSSSVWRFSHPRNLECGLCFPYLILSASGPGRCFKRSQLFIRCASSSKLRLATSGTVPNFQLITVPQTLTTLSSLAPSHHYSIYSLLLLSLAVPIVFILQSSHYILTPCWD